MDLSRRAVAFGLPLLASGYATAAQVPAPFLPPAPVLPGRPIVIAHRGACGERPEHTASAYRLAIDQGADFVEPDLVMTKDGVLVIRHETEIGGTTDIAARPEFASRHTTKSVDGVTTTGWFAEDFTLAELKTLRCRERLPAVRPGSAVFDGMDPILTFQELIDLTRAESLRVGRTIGLYVEIKHPMFLASIGMNITSVLLDALRANDLSSREAPVFIQCFDPVPLRALRPLTTARLSQLVGGGASGIAATTPSGLAEIAAYADGVGPSYELVTPQTNAGLGAPTSLVRDAHAVGLVVHPWTVRAENQFLPKALWNGEAASSLGRVDAVFDALYAAGIDGLFSDFTALNVRARDAALAGRA